ncbi:MAG: histidine triad nucleotide-binding protein [bacterium]|nr:histidine triad nucleotide-binding protein [bacterium]
MNDCLFCKIVQGDIPAEKVFENDNVLAFKDINPQAPVHILVIPKNHYADISVLYNEEAALIVDIFEAVKKVTEKLYIDDSGFRVVVNKGTDAGQLVNHIHFHVLGGRKLEWPPG